MNPAERIKQSEIDKNQHIDEILEACRGKTMHDLQWNRQKAYSKRNN